MTKFQQRPDVEQQNPPLSTVSVGGGWRSPRILLLAIIISLSGLGGFGLRYVTRSVESEEPIAENTAGSRRAVTTMVVAEQLIEQRLEATGSVIAADLLPILPRATGLLMSLPTLICPLPR